MLSPRLINYPECGTISQLLKDIDWKLVEMAGSLYNNTVFMLNKPVNYEAISDLLNYKRILLFKYCNPDYAGKYTVEMIASKIKLLKYK